MHAHVRSCAYAYACIPWLSLVKVRGQFLYFYLYHVSSKDRAQVVKREPLPPPQPSHWPSPLSFLRQSHWAWAQDPPVCATPPQPCMLRIQIGVTVSNFYVGAGLCAGPSAVRKHFTHWAISAAPGLTLKIPRLIYLIWSICHFPGICLNRNNRWKEQRWKTWGRQPKKSVWRWKLNLQNYMAYTYIGRNSWSRRVNWG